ncbi:hypothetical protein NDU88_008686 [Pleurodeles waltl]|uniref:Uncharacterized protein n=1 Tax=Pleurodeles waltl TaxID=8319 RepID=A0AAV7NYN7_PLEWA|nr:hypothetical protein NDU88_008686 [Pleurodeles waltl]
MDPGGGEQTCARSKFKMTRNELDAPHCLGPSARPPRDNQRSEEELTGVRGLMSLHKAPRGVMWASQEFNKKSQARAEPRVWLGSTCLCMSQALNIVGM